MFIRKLIIASCCLIFVVLAGCTDRGESADLQKGVDAYEQGDYATALREFTPLADQGNARAQFKLGVMYAKGHGVPQDYKKAVQWYRLAAEQGNASAQNNLGVMYGKGLGILQDDEAALKWHRLAAEQGDANAQFNLGLKYATGRSVLEKNRVYAYMWFNIAAYNGVDDAVKERISVQVRMNADDISAARKLAHECIEKNYKDC